jgi:hypothetical protein
MDDKDRAEILMQLADFRMTRVESRRAHEWKVTVSLWALLAAGIAYVRIPAAWPVVCRALALIALAVILIVVIWLHAAWWVGDHWARSKEDILASFFYADRAHDLVSPDSENIEKLRKKSPETWPAEQPRYRFLCDAKCRAQVLTTAALALGVWLSAMFGRP